MNQALAEMYADLGYDKLLKMMYDNLMIHTYCFEHAVIITQFTQGCIRFFS
jgi:hypothetical protein